MKITEAIKHAIDGNALLFVGSGFSVGATSINNKEFPTGRELAKKLYSAAGGKAIVDDLAKASSAFLKKKSPHELVELLETTFTTNKITKEQNRIAEIPWRIIFTTNYDDVVETAFKQNGLNIKSVTVDMDSHEYTSKKTICVHVNGFVKTLTETSINNSFKLTNHSYQTENFIKSKWSFILRREIEAAKAIIFIGYSMYDLDIGRILHQDATSISKTIFIEWNGLSEEDVEFSIQQDFGTIYPIGMQGFFEEFEQIRKTYSKQNLPIEPKSLRKFSPTLQPAQATDDEYWGLLLKGDYDENAIYTSVLNNGRYFQNRSEIAKINELITSKASGVRVCFVLGDLGNGKTLTLLGCASKLHKAGYEIYFLDDTTPFDQADVDFFISIKEPCVIFVENYTRHIDALRSLLLRSNKNVKFICSARTVLHEIISNKTDDIFSRTECYEIFVDSLNNKESENLSVTFSEYKIWGSRDSWSNDRKVRHITKDCKSEFSNILLDLITSPDIQERFEYLFSSFRTKNETGKVFITTAILAMLGYDRPSSSLIAELTNSNHVFSRFFTSNESVRQMMHLGAGTVTPRSSIIAKFGLSHFTESNFVIETLIEITKRAHEIGREYNSIGEIYFRIYRDLVTFSVLQPIMPEKKRRESLIRFYEAIKNLDAAKNHPHFWLQYAIARLSMETKDDTRIAKSYLDSAYSHASKRENYHTKHMDNVLARYHLTSARYQTERVFIMENLTPVHDLLLKEARTEKTEAPYKVAKIYAKILAEKASVLQPNDLQFIKMTISALIESAEKLPDNIKIRRSVSECVKLLNEALVVYFK